MIRRLGVFLTIVIGWVIFRAPDLATATRFLGDMFAIRFDGAVFDPSTTARAKIALLIGLTSVAFPSNLSIGRWLERQTNARGQGVRLAHTLVLLPVSLMLVATTSFSPFLYFQF